MGGGARERRGVLPAHDRSSRSLTGLQKKPGRASSSIMPYFSHHGSYCRICGADPWSARDALVPLSARRIKALHTTRADEGVGRGRGRPPYKLRRCSVVGIVCSIELKHAPSVRTIVFGGACFSLRSVERSSLQSVIGGIFTLPNGRGSSCPPEPARAPPT